MQQWRHCPGILNPADIPTRGMSASEFANSELWFHGPEFIRKPKEFWPDDISSDIKEAPSKALIEEKVKVFNLLTTKTEKPQPRVNLEEIIDLQQFSSIDKLLRVMSYVIRFVSELYARLEKKLLLFPKHQ